MQIKKNIDYEQKLQAVTEYLQGQTSQAKVAAKYGVSPSSFQTWLRKYSAEGDDGLKKSDKNKKYSIELKYAAVFEYLSGSMSQQEICKKYKISSKTQLQRWILWYNSHKKLKSIGSGGKRLMTKGRKVTFDEKVEIVQYCIANGKDYYAAMEKYQISYQQIYSWLRKYDNGGIDALVDRRGKAKPENELTDTDRLRIENKMLEAKNIELEMEIRLLKKLQEIERRRR